MEDNKIIQGLLENGYHVTSKPEEAIYITRGGNLISGDFDMGSRGTDHRMIECIVNTDRYGNLWEVVHHDLGLVRLVPETKIALIDKDQILTKKQRIIIKQSGYELERY